MHSFIFDGHLETRGKRGNPHAFRIPKKKTGIFVAPWQGTIHQTRSGYQGTIFEKTDELVTEMCYGNHKFVFCFLDRAFSIMKTKINQQNAQINSGLIYY